MTLEYSSTPFKSRQPRLPNSRHFLKLPSSLSNRTNWDDSKPLKQPQLTIYSTCLKGGKRVFLFNTNIQLAIQRSNPNGCKKPSNRASCVPIEEDVQSHVLCSLPGSEGCRSVSFVCWPFRRWRSRKVLTNSGRCRYLFKQKHKDELRKQKGTTCGGIGSKCEYRN